MIIHTNRFIPKRFDAITYHLWFTPFSVILIRKCKDKDKALLEHELTHAKQIKCDWLWGIKYQFSKKYRLQYELEAYKVQYAYDDLQDMKYFAECLANNYKLGITVDEAIKLLTD